MILIGKSERAFIALRIRAGKNLRDDAGGSGAFQHLRQMFHQARAAEIAADVDYCMHCFSLNKVGHYSPSASRFKQDTSVPLEMCKAKAAANMAQLPRLR